MRRQQLQQLITWKEQFLPPAFPHLAGSQFIVFLSSLFLKVLTISHCYLLPPAHKTNESIPGTACFLAEA